jgi:hypothetical protein
MAGAAALVGCARLVGCELLEVTMTLRRDRVTLTPVDPRVMLRP